MKCLVTGCAGFIGSTLTDQLLKKGREVVGVDCFSQNYGKKQKKENISDALQNPDFALIERDLVDCDLDGVLSDIDVVFHLAAKPGVRESWGSGFSDYVQNNIAATQKLLDGCVKAGVKKFVYSSSSSVYGKTSMPMNEETPLKPFSPYGVTKLAAENLCKAYQENFDISTVCLRYFTVYGPRQRPDMAFHKFIKSINEKNELQVFGNGRQTRDFTYIKDVVDATIKSTRKKCWGEVINIGGGSKTSLIDAINVIEEVCAKEAKIRFTECKKGDVTETLADISKAKKLLNYKPKTKLKQGVEKQVAWMSQK